MVRAQATPQHASGQSQEHANAASNDHQRPITYKPVTADGMKAFFSGIKKSESTSSTAHLEANLPPPGIVLPPAPVPQILTQEVTAANKVNEKEDAILTRLYKMDRTELEKLVEKTKAHPLFKAYCQDVIQPEHDDCTYLVHFGTTHVEEELCDFQMWLDYQADALRHSHQHCIIDARAAAPRQSAGRFILFGIDDPPTFWPQSFTASACHNHPGHTKPKCC